MNVFIIYSADANLSYSSMNVEGVASSKERAIKLLTPRLKKQAKEGYKDATYARASEMFADLKDNLRTINQTQTLDTNYIIRLHQVNKLS